MNNLVRTAWWASAALGICAFAAPVEAWACGCFAPPNPATPVVQAGEQVVFAMKDGNVTMHVRVQYSGPAEEFGWLLPLPAVPELEVGTEELFFALEQRTRPTFRLIRQQNGQCLSAQDAGAGVFDSSAPGGGDGGTSNQPPGGVLVRRESVGPYDTAVLRADNMDAMLQWLQDNRFFIPTDLANAVGPYIRPGGYFLALKLLSDRDAGDIAPIVLDYPAELPMIPMVLTQVGAEEDMPVTVYVLGDHRAIPRNFRHTVLNLEHIDWFSGGSNYRDVVTEAVDEADGHHAFVTEMAGDTAFMVDVLDGPNRFGDRASLETTTDALTYVNALRSRGFSWTTTLVGFLREAFEMPQAVRDAGFDEDTYYANLEWFWGPYRDQNPAQFEGADFDFDPVDLTDKLWTVIVLPSKAAGALFRDYPKITRLFTTLSPDEMTKDPVFSFNPSLPDVESEHTATFTVTCEDGQFPPSEGNLELPDGRIFETTPWAWRDRDRAGQPFSARIEILAEEGAPTVEVDNMLGGSGNNNGNNNNNNAGGGPNNNTYNGNNNTSGTGDPSGSGRYDGCTCTAEQAGAGSAVVLLGLIALGFSRRRR